MSALKRSMTAMRKQSAPINQGLLNANARMVTKEMERIVAVRPQERNNRLGSRD